MVADACGGLSGIASWVFGVVLDVAVFGDFGFPWVLACVWPVVGYCWWLCTCGFVFVLRPFLGLVMV